MRASLIPSQYLGFNALSITSLYDENEYGRKNSIATSAVMLSSLGYFIFDSLWCIACGDESAVMFAHHALSTVRRFFSLLSHYVVFDYL